MRPEAGPAAEAPAQRGAPAFDYWLTYGILLGMVAIPALDKAQMQDAQGNALVGEVWSAVIYLAAALRLRSNWHVAKRLFARSYALWTFLGLMFASVVWSVEPGTTFVNSIELIGTTIASYYFVSRFTLQQFLLILAFTFGTIAAVSLAVVIAAPARGRMDWGGGAWSGIYQDKNNLGAAMALAAISLAICVAGSSRRRTAVALALLLCVLLLVGSSSATAFSDCAVVLAFAAVAWVCRSSRLGGAARILVPIVVIGGGAAASLFGITPDSLLTALGRNSTLTGRTDFWPYLQQAVADRPLLGYGYNAFFRSASGGSYLSYYVVEAGGWTPYHAHNSFLQICLDAGYVGVAALLWLLIVSLARGAVFLWREQSRLAVWPLSIVAYLILGSFTETYLGNFNTYEWVLFVAALLYPLRDERPVRRRASSIAPADVRTRRLRYSAMS